MCSMGGGADHTTGRGNFGGRYEEGHCNQWEISGAAV